MKRALSLRGAARAQRAILRIAFGLAALVLSSCTGVVAPERTADPDRVPDDVPLPARVLVVNTLSDTISSLDLASGMMNIHAATAGDDANRIVEAPAHGRFLVIASGDNEVEFYDRRSLTPGGAVHVGVARNPFSAALWGTSRALVSNWLASEIAEIDLEGRALGRRLETSPAPEGILVVGSRAYVACTNYEGSTQFYGPGIVEVIDLNLWSKLASITVPRNPQEILLAPDGRIHVLCTGTYGAGPVPEAGSIVVIDPATFALVGSVPLGGAPGAFALGSKGAVWVAGYEGGVRLYDAASSTSRAVADPDLAAIGYSAIAYDAEAGLFYIANFSLDLLVAVDETSERIVQAWLVGDGPVHIVVSR